MPFHCKVIDLTHSFTGSMPVHPWDERAHLVPLRTKNHDGFNDWLLTSGMHVGTHIDGPGHLTDSSLCMATMPIEHFIGEGLLVDARGREIDVALFEHVHIDREGLIVLILTGRDTLWGTPEYFTEHPVLSPDVARFLIMHRVKMIGIDFFSPDTYPFEIHKMLFDHQILIAENLTNLDKLMGIDRFMVAALPLKLETDSALARVVALV